MSRIATKRLQKELAELQQKGPPAGCRLIQAENLEEWVIALQVLGESVYEGEEFALRFRFSTSYPIDSPEVTFLTTSPFRPPEHPHVYTNGRHICASVLGSGWSPVLNVQSLLLTMQSMLASCKKKELPPDNDRYIRNAPKSPKDTRWAYHDDTV
ncbi:ubiquitin-conjugating enzyme/RWD-like protein [Rhodotorula toruloides]